MTYVEVEDLIFEDGDGSTPGLYFSRIPGWRDPATPNVNLRNRPRGQGAFSPGKTFRGSKTFGMEGHFESTTIEHCYQMMERLAGIGADGNSFTFKVVDEWGPQSMTVWIANGPTMPDVLWEPWFDFAFDVVAVDPRKYGELVTTFTYLPTAGGGRDWELGWGQSWGAIGDLGRVVARNTGNAETTAVYEVHGGLPGGFLITEVESGREVRDPQPIPLGSILYLDPRTGRASLNNQVDRRLARKDWWTVPPGGTSTVQFAALGGVVGTPRLVQRFAPASL